MKTSRHSNLLVLILILVLINASAPAQPGYYPPPSSVIFHNDTLTIYPPDSLPAPPVVLLGYNIYVDSVFFDNILNINPTDTVDFVFEAPALLPGNHEFCAKALYNDWISDAACDTDLVIYGLELPFLEDWSSGTFEENLWDSSSENWIIEDEDGNPSPAVEFRGDPVQADYEMSIESYPLNAVGIYNGRIWLDFDIQLNALQSTGNEWLRAQVWNWLTQVWNTVAEYQNDEASFTWSSEHINIRSQTMNKVFRVRFLATGANSSDIQNWSIDNIHIYRSCDGPIELELFEHQEYNELQWLGPDCCRYDEWIHWDDEVNSGNSIGTGEAVEFDVAARWISAQLGQFQGASISAIAFFPAEAAAIYHVRVWTGSGPDTLIADQLVNSPVIGQWNYTTLTTPLPLDITKDLWVGYHINTTTGWPAGVDDGPAIDGYGNMMYYDSAWQTLLEINGDLNFNWNIACYLTGINPGGSHLAYNLYRATNNGGFQLYGYVDDNTEFLDSNIILSDVYCYKVTGVWSKNGDTCESVPTNIACEHLMLGTGSEVYAKHIMIYPNPANTTLNIEAEEVIKEVRIYNPLGEMVLKMEIGNSEGRVDVSGLGNGLFFIEVRTKNDVYKSKVLMIR